MREGLEHLDLLVAHRVGREVTGGSMATRVRSCIMWFWTMSRSAPGLLVVRRPGYPPRRILGHGDLHLVHVAAFQSGSKMPLPNRKTRMFCTVSLPR